LWAKQLREVLGEEGELDSRMLEESWASGVAVGWERFRARREPVKAGGGVSFAELNCFGSFAFTESSVGEQRACGDFAQARDSYGASWLRDPAQEVRSRKVEPAQGSEDGRGDVAKKTGVMTRERACEVLGVGEGCSAMQLKEAYRRMVSAWHPDRMEQSEERVRAFATEQMMAINEAYHFLRGDGSGMAGNA